MSRIAMLTLVAILLTLACAGEVDFPDGVSGASAPAPDAGVDAAVVEDSASREFFDDYVQPMLASSRPKGACATCHQGVSPGDGPDFMGQTPVDNYYTLTTSPGMVIAGLPENSRLLTRGDHDGNAFCTGLGIPYANCTQDEYPIVSEWIRMEAEN